MQTDWNVFWRLGICPYQIFRESLGQESKKYIEVIHWVFFFLFYLCVNLRWIVVSPAGRQRSNLSSRLWFLAIPKLIIGLIYVTIIKSFIRSLIHPHTFINSALKLCIKSYFILLWVMTPLRLWNHQLIKSASLQDTQTAVVLYGLQQRHLLSVVRRVCNFTLLAASHSSQCDSAITSVAQGGGRRAPGVISLSGAKYADSYFSSDCKHNN